jgi:hypothetical protein
MSQWRVKGFVQDSDEEEEDIESSTTGSTRNSQHSVNARDVDATAKTDRIEERSNAVGEATLLWHVYGPDHETLSPSKELLDDGQPTYDASTAMTQVAEATPATGQPATPPIVIATELAPSARFESPDPLLGSPTPKTKRVDSSSYSSQILGVPSVSQGTRKSNLGKPRMRFCSTIPMAVTFLILLRTSMSWIREISRVVHHSVGQHHQSI